MDINALKSLDSQIKKIDEKIELCNGDKRAVKEEEKSIDRKLGDLKRRRSNLKTKADKEREKRKDKKITDHARVRYLERIIGLNIDELDADILLEENHRNKLRDGIIITIIKK